MVLDGSVEIPRFSSYPGLDSKEVTPSEGEADRGTRESKNTENKNPAREGEGNFEL